MNKETITLTTAIADAARQAFSELFDTVAAGEHFYYCALVTTEEGFAPVVSAWSREAFEREELDEIAKWSYADSPYCTFGYDEYFGEVERLFEARPTMDDLDDEEWDDELDLRLEAMTEALAILDREGLFARNQPRHEVVVNAELMPPDASNAERALRLNVSATIPEDYLEETANE